VFLQPPDGHARVFVGKTLSSLERESSDRVKNSILYANIHTGRGPAGAKEKKPAETSKSGPRIGQFGYRAQANAERQSFPRYG